MMEEKRTLVRETDRNKTDTDEMMETEREGQ